MFTKVLKLIQESIKDHLGKISQVRLQSWFILAEILITGIFFLGIEAFNAYLSIWVKNEAYAPSSESIFIFGMVLAHHLAMLGIKKSAEASSFPSLDKKNDTTTKLNINNKYNGGIDNEFRERDINIEVSRGNGSSGNSNGSEDIGLAQNLRDL